MPVSINDIKVVHSGGAGNALAVNDLGGAISTHANKIVQSQSFSTSGMAGVTINEVYGNPEGSGNLLFTNSTKFLSWRPFGQGTYYGVNVSVAGTYLIGSTAGYMVVTVNPTLMIADSTVAVIITNLQSNVFLPVSAGDSLAGCVHYRCLYILNTSTTFTAPDVRLWIASNTPGGDTIDIALDTTAGLNGTPAVVANEDTAPSPALTFSAPTTYTAGLQLGTLPIGGRYAFWQRRTVPAETRGTVISNGAVLAIGVTI